MGNFINRLFSSEHSRETGSKRLFSRHNKVSLHESNGKKTSIDSLQSISQESHGSPTQYQETASKQEVADSSPLEQPAVNLEASPFQRDFLPTHQPLVSLEKSRPRRSNIRRSSRMNASMGKGDNVVRPGHHLLTSVPSITGDEPLADQHHHQSVISNRADPSLPVIHSSDVSGASQWTNEMKIMEEPAASLEIARGPSVIDESVDELSPNERHKVAKSRISQMFIKREQQQQQGTKHISLLAEAPAGGFVINTDYERVYESIDNYGHYEQEQETDKYHEHVQTVSDENECLHDEVEDGGEQASELSKPEVVPRRKMMQGNSLLIDELKKRQSTFYQTAAE